MERSPINASQSSSLIEAPSRLLIDVPITCHLSESPIQSDPRLSSPMFNLSSGKALSGRRRVLPVNDFNMDDIQTFSVRPGYLISRKISLCREMYFYSDASSSIFDFDMQTPAFI